MDHISTAGMYQSALLNFFNAQHRQTEAQAQIATGKVADDLKGFATSAEKLSATKTLFARTSSYLDNASALGGRLAVQDTALVQLQSATQSARDAIANAIASGDASPLMSTLQNQFTSASDALNTQYEGRYLFAGGKTDTPPFSGTAITDLTSAPSVASLFQNDQLVPTNRVDDHTTLNTGVLADSIGAPVMNALQQVVAYDQGGSGPLTGKLNQTQMNFLQGLLATFDSATQTATYAAAQNGVVQNKITSAQTHLENRKLALTTALGDITDADFATAKANLDLAQVAVQASAQVFAKLNGSSLLNVLSATS
jgi:flagellar hook-associated protein 3 FlgL